MVARRVIRSATLCALRASRHARRNCSGRANVTLRLTGWRGETTIPRPGDRFAVARAAGGVERHARAQHMAESGRLRTAAGCGRRRDACDAAWPWGRALWHPRPRVDGAGLFQRARLWARYDKTG